MRKKLFTAMIIVAAFGFTACQDDPTMDELIDDIELNQTTDPDDDDDTTPPGNNGNGGTSGGSGTTGGNG